VYSIVTVLLQRNSRPSYSNEKSLNYTYFAFVLHVFFLAYLGYFVTFTVTIKHREENGNRGLLELFQYNGMTRIQYFNDRTDQRSADIRSASCHVTYYCGTHVMTWTKLCETTSRRILHLMYTVHQHSAAAAAAAAAAQEQNRYHHFLCVASTTRYKSC